MYLMEKGAVLLTDEAIEYLKISKPTFLKYFRLGKRNEFGLDLFGGARVWARIREHSGAIPTCGDQGKQVEQTPQSLVGENRRVDFILKYVKNIYCRRHTLWVLSKMDLIY